MTTSFRCWAEIDIEAMRSNLRTIRSMVRPGIRIIAVVKADAYGHGLPEVARQLDRDVDLFGVASLSEARTIRSTGAQAPVLILGPALPEERAPIFDEAFIPTDFNASKRQPDTQNACTRANGCRCILPSIPGWDESDPRSRRRVRFIVRFVRCLNFR